MKNPRIRRKDIVLGTGPAAEGDVWVKARVVARLNRGEVIQSLWADNDEIVFRLQDRDVIPGLRSAAEGMKAGGKREATIPPHLAFGTAGIPGVVPPDAILRLELELMKVGGPGEAIPHPGGSPKGRILSISEDGEESSTLPRWRFVLHDLECAHHPSSVFLVLEWNTRSDGKWQPRTAKHTTVPIPMDAEEIERFIDAAVRTSDSGMAGILGANEVHTHGGHSPTRADSDSSICRHLSLWDAGESKVTVYLRMDSPVWTDTSWGRRVMNLTRPHLSELPQPPAPRRLP